MKAKSIFILVVLLIVLSGSGSAALALRGASEPFVGPAVRLEANLTVPSVRDIFTDDFESGTLDSWREVSPADLRLVSGGGRSGSIGLSVAISEQRSYLYQKDVARAEQGYLSFWFNPNGADIPDQGTSWPPGKSVRIAGVKGAEWWHLLVSLQVRRLAGQGYRAFLEWDADDGRHYDYEVGEFDLIDGWQKITLGYRVDEWVAVWLNDAQVRRVSGVTHEEAQGEIIEIGKSSTNSSIVPTGNLRYDDVAFQVPNIEHLWVDAISGDDGNDGLDADTALRTIQKAGDLAGPGTTVHILPGVYRETVWPAVSGTAADPILYRAEAGPGTVSIRGSEPSTSLSWTPLAADTIGLPPGVDPADIYYADLSAWALDEPPRFIVQLGASGAVIARLPLAREPDWSVITDWRYHEFWWAADGGQEMAACDPPTDPDPRDCDWHTRSTTQLTDRTDDVEPPGVEPGNLTTLGDLTGATIVAMDTYQGHYVYRRKIVAHDVRAGRVTVDRPAEHDSGSGNPGLGWGSKYYVEGKPHLLDTPGEWWYDASSGLLYLWPLTPGNPATMNIEISRRDNGFSLKNRSYILLDGLTIEFLQENALSLDNRDYEKSYGNTIRNSTLRYANQGLWLMQDVSANSPSGNVVDGFFVKDSEIAYMDTHAIRVASWWEDNADPDAFTRSGVSNMVIRNNEFHHLGFRTDKDEAVGMVFHHADKLIFEGNHVHHVGHIGVHFSESVIQSSKEYGFAPHEIKTGEILIKDNVFEKACQLSADCGALKFWGRPPDTHVFRDVLIIGNVFRDTYGWTYVSEKRGRWSGGANSAAQGMGGFGLYVDMASGLHVYRNIVYNNAHVGFRLSGVWRDGDIVFYNNIVANSLYGFHMGGASHDTHGSVNTQVVNNIIVNNEAYGIQQSDADGVYDNMIFDHNLYYNNGWRPYAQGGLYAAGDMAIHRDVASDYYQSLSDIQAQTAWEAHGATDDPNFVYYDVSDHDLTDGSWPDFRLTSASAAAIDGGTTALPASLRALLETFKVDDSYLGSAYDIGPYEWGIKLRTTPAARSVWPGGTARYKVSLSPTDWPHPVTLTVGALPPSLTLHLSPTVISLDVVATLTLTDQHPLTDSEMPGLWYRLPITGTTGDFTHSTMVGFLVGGSRVYLPLMAEE